MKVLFVRPPRYMWAFLSENSRFWQPLGFASMAAVLRENIDDIDVKILDFPIMKIGWQKVPIYILREKPDVLCVGEETVSAHEAIRLIEMTKEMFPECKIICGGVHFSYMIKDTLMNYPVDFIVRFEGELTLLELIIFLQKGRKDFEKIKGIAFKRQGKVIETELRPLLDMEKLPIPAYDLLPMGLYGKGAHSHPSMVAIEHSRGCSCSCNFCILWKQMGKIDPKKGAVTPCYRTKSPKKTFDEVQYLAEKYGRKTFCWVDPTWNVDPGWSEEFSDLMIGSGLDTDHSTWMRADFLVRDEKNGIFYKQVKAGVKQVMIGIERTDKEELAYLEKANYSFDTTKKAFEIIRRYPNILSVATYIYGIPDESWASLKRFYNMLSKIPFDIGVPIPITPYPGTKFFDELEKKNLLELKKFRYYNFINIPARSKYMTRIELQIAMFLNEFRSRMSYELEKEISLRSDKSRRKTAFNSLQISRVRSGLRATKNIISKLFFDKEINLNIKPKWYDQ